MKLTFDEAIANHRKMWNWIADETEKRENMVDKRDYFNENYADITTLHHCFCCQYTKDHSDTEKENCEICPIEWGKRCLYYGCETSNSAYRKWRETNYQDWQSASKYAREIAKLPAREEVRQ